MSINSLNSVTLRRICYHLQDRDLMAFGMTSKKMLCVAKEEFKARDEFLKQLLSPYTISRKFNVHSLEKTDLFLIGDVHRNQQCKSTQTAFINFWASRGPVVLILEEDASDVFNEKDKNLLCDRKNLIFRENIYTETI